jgi:hypothetical protein
MAGSKRKRRKRPARTAERHFFRIVGDRFCEPATWAGLGPLIASAGWQAWPEHWQIIGVSAMGFCGFMAILMGQAQR